MKIIAFGGLATAGKTTAATAAARALFDAGLTPLMEQFAGPLKKASNLIGFGKGGPYDAQYRQFCQQVGTMARDQSPNWWVDLLLARIHEMQDAEFREAEAEAWHERCILIDDVRYPNEVEAIRKIGGKLIFISAGRVVNRHDPVYQHVSEKLAMEYESGDLSDETFDITISNNARSDHSLALFQKTVGDLAVRLATSPMEELR